MLGNKSSLLTLLLLPSLVLANNIWTVTLGGGVVRFRGVIIAESCRVEAGDKHMIVDMGQISSNRFHHVGEDVNPVPFNIHLQECNTAVREGANKQVISSQADSLIKISRIWADFFPANTSNQPI